MRENKRAVGIIIQNNKILLMRRIRNGQEYFVFPGGGVEEGETLEEATIREIKEELSLDAKLDKLLFKMFNPSKNNQKEMGRDDNFYLITEFSGELKLGGEELERMSEDDKYYPEWHEIKKASQYKNLYPQKAAKKLFKILEKIIESK